MQDAKNSFDENGIDRSTTIVANEWTGEMPVWESRFWLCGQCFCTISIIITSNSKRIAKQFSGMNLISISLYYKIYTHWSTNLTDKALKREANNNKPKGTSNKPQPDKATQPTNVQNHNRTTTPTTTTTTKRKKKNTTNTQQQIANRANNKQLHKAKGRPRQHP